MQLAGTSQHCPARNVSGLLSRVIVISPPSTKSLASKSWQWLGTFRLGVRLALTTRKPSRRISASNSRRSIDVLQDVPPCRVRSRRNGRRGESTVDRHGSVSVLPLARQIPRCFLARLSSWRCYRPVSYRHARGKRETDENKHGAMPPDRMPDEVIRR